MLANITYGTFLFFGSFVVCGVLFVYFLMPETKGFTLEEMDVLFSIRGLTMNKHKTAKQMIARQRQAEAVGNENKLTIQHLEEFSA